MTGAAAACEWPNALTAADGAGYAPMLSAAPLCWAGEERPPSKEAMWLAEAPAAAAGAVPLTAVADVPMTAARLPLALAPIAAICCCWAASAAAAASSRACC